MSRTSAFILCSQQLIDGRHIIQQAARRGDAKDMLSMCPCNGTSEIVHCLQELQYRPDTLLPVGQAIEYKFPDIVITRHLIERLVSMFYVHVFVLSVKVLL